jgi:rod shape-determining protein MreC
MKRFVRWWSFNQSAALLAVVVLGAAGFVKATQGLGLSDLNSSLTKPFKADGQVQQKLLDAQTQALQQQIQELEAKNRTLQSLLKLPTLPNYQRIAAPVLSRSADNWWQQLVLGKGSAHGIKVDSVVVAPGGLVGRVMSVTPQSSRVLLASDPTSEIGITVTRSRKVGTIRGRSSRDGVLNFFEKTTDIKVDDVIVTSTYSSLFPPGIIVGRVTKLDLEKRPTPQAVVEFAAPIENLEWVNVLVHG